MNKVNIYNGEHCMPITRTQHHRVTLLFLRFRSRPRGVRTLYTIT